MTIVTRGQGVGLESPDETNDIPVTTSCKIVIIACYGCCCP